MLRKIIMWAAVIFMVYYLAAYPSGAAHFLHGAVGWLGKAGHSMATFVNSL